MARNQQKKERQEARLIEQELLKIWRNVLEQLCRRHVLEHRITNTALHVVVVKIQFIENMKLLQSMSSYAWVGSRFRVSECLK